MLGTGARSWAFLEGARAGKSFLERAGADGKRYLLPNTDLNFKKMQFSRIYYEFHFSNLAIAKVALLISFLYIGSWSLLLLVRQINNYNYRCRYSWKTDKYRESKQAKGQRTTIWKLRYCYRNIGKVIKNILKFLCTIIIFVEPIIM